VTRDTGLLLREDEVTFHCLRLVTGVVNRTRRHPQLAQAHDVHGPLEVPSRLGSHDLESQSVAPDHSIVLPCLLVLLVVNDRTVFDSDTRDHSHLSTDAALLETFAKVRKLKTVGCLYGSASSGFALLYRRCVVYDGTSLMYLC
jgi:hypothetical protein